MDIATQGDISFSSYFFSLLQLHLLRMGDWLSGVVAKKVLKESASVITALPSEPYLVAGIIGVGLFSWGAANLCKKEED